MAAACCSAWSTGVLVYVFLMRKMTGEMVLAAVLTTVALGILLRGVMVLVWSAQQQYPAQPLQITNFAIALPGGARISLCRSVLVFTTAFIYSALLCSCASGAGAYVCAQLGRTRCLPRSAASTPSRSSLGVGLGHVHRGLAGMLIACDAGVGRRLPPSASRRFRRRSSAASTASPVRWRARSSSPWPKSR